MKKLLVCLSAIISVLFAVNFAFGAVGFKVSPMQLNLTPKGKNVGVSSLTVTNGFKTPMQVTVKQATNVPKKFKLNGSKVYLKATPSQFTLRPGKQQVVRVWTKDLSHAAAGRVGYLFVTNNTASKPMGFSSPLGTKIGTHVAFKYRFAIPVVKEAVRS
jgi:P pilus assembly chaperone PapD